MKTPTIIAALLIVTATLGRTDQALGQSGSLEQRLAAATRVDCRFTVLATGTWDKADTSIAVTDSELQASFFDVNISEGTAEAEGRFGATFIVVRYSHGYLHFLQMSDAGPLHLTTVLAQESAEGRMKAIHTRHEYSPTILPGFTSRPEMYVGDCTIEG
jgi:hypothetical protein